MSNVDSFSFPSATKLSLSNTQFAPILQSSYNHSPPHLEYDWSSTDYEEDEEVLSSSSSSSSTSISRRPSHDENNHVQTLNPSPHWSHSSDHDSPYTKSPWLNLSSVPLPHQHHINLIGSLVREEGHVYSLATSSHFLYTGSDSNNIRVWTKSNLSDSGGFKSGSGLVKSIVVGLNCKIFTGHQDGKIRIWQCSESPTTSTSHKRVGSLPTWKDSLKSWVNPTTKRRSEIGRHLDAVSCLSLDRNAGLLYSASWDKTVKVWRLSDSRCVETIKAHADAVNAVVAAGFGGLVFSGSADGIVKLWKRHEIHHHGNKTIRHSCIETLMEQNSAVTSLVVMRFVIDFCSTLYAGSSDGLVNFWDFEKTTGIMRYGGGLRGHKLPVLCLATAGSLVLSGSADSSVCVWRRDEVSVGGRDHVCLSVLTGHTAPVKCLAVDEEFDSSGRSSCSDEDEEEKDDARVVGNGRRWRVYSGSLDNSVKVWMVQDLLFPNTN